MKKGGWLLLVNIYTPTAQSRKAFQRKTSIFYGNNFNTIIQQKRPKYNMYRQIDAILPAMCSSAAKRSALAYIF